jgi:hypothetical protein
VVLLALGPAVPGPALAEEAGVRGGTFRTVHFLKINLGGFWLTLNSARNPRKRNDPPPLPGNATGRGRR